MEFSTAKKKKRKTRKCLDEIRKRSRHTTQGECFGESSQHRHKINRTDESRIHRLVTINRLTLNMLPKAIQSETITRPLLEQIKQKSSYNLRGLDKNMKFRSLTEDSKVACFEHCKSMVSNDSMPLFDVDEESLHEFESNSQNNPLRNYLNLHSPTNVNIRQTPPELSTNNYSASSTSSFSSQTIDRDNGLELYEELMNKISSHLKKVTSAVIKEDVINNTKISLQKLYNMSWSKGYKNCNSISDNEKNSKLVLLSPKDPIVQNPLDYIRLKHVQQGKCNDDCNSSLSEAFSSSPAAPISHLQLPSRKSAFEVTLYDTPQYNYYPHRLNQ